MKFSAVLFFGCVAISIVTAAPSDKEVAVIVKTLTMRWWKETLDKLGEYEINVCDRKRSITCLFICTCI